MSVDPLRTLPPTHKYYLYGLYFIGASDVAMGPEHLAEVQEAAREVVNKVIG